MVYGVKILSLHKVFLYVRMLLLLLSFFVKGGYYDNNFYCYTFTVLLLTVILKQICENVKDFGPCIRGEIAMSRINKPSAIKFSKNILITGITHTTFRQVINRPIKTIKNKT